MTPLHGFAIVPADSPDPIAVFFTFDDALDWALHRIGRDQFRIHSVALETPPSARGQAVA